MADLSNYPIQSLEEVLSNPKASRRLKQQVQKELDSRYAAQGQGRTPNPVFEPISGNPATMSGQPAGFFESMALNALPSFTQLGDDLTTGIANAFTDPVGTAANMLPGMAEHYTQRYFTPQPGQPWYSDALNTVQADPFGAMADLGLVGGVLRATSKAGSTLNKAGRIMERADPITLGMGAAQTGWMEGQRHFDRRPGETMGGTAYGVPRGRQRENLGDYVNTVESAIEQGFPPTIQGAEAARAASSSIGAEVGRIIDEWEASGQTVNRSDLIKELMELQKKAGTSVEVPYRNAIDKMIDDIMQSPDHTIGPREMQNLKERYASQVNYDSATPSTERMTQEGYSDASKVVRERLRSNPELRDTYDAYGEAQAVTDVTQRGAAADLSKPPHGFDPWGALYRNIAPLITGQSQFQRAGARVAYNKGNRLEAFGKATEKTPYGILRQGAYASDMSGKTPEEQRWHVGRLWEE